MADSELSASELRQRYHRGGSAKDDELTAKQLRARHAIPSNKDDFSTSQSDGKSLGGSPVLLIVVALLLLGAVGFFMLKK